MFQLSGKTAIITGGGSGIGRAIAGLFAKQGVLVFIFDLDENLAEQVINEIKTAGGKAEKLIVDVASQEKVRQAVTVVKEMAGGVDILVNNAGVAHVGNADNTSEADFDRIYSINIKGVYNCLHEVYL